MSNTLDEKTTVPLLAGLRGVWTVFALLVSAVGTMFMVREDVLTKISAGNATTQKSLTGIEAEISDLNHRFDMFQQKVGLGLDDRWRKADMKLWIWQAKQKYPDLPDVQ